MKGTLVPILYSLVWKALQLCLTRYLVGPPSFDGGDFVALHYLHYVMPCEFVRHVSRYIARRYGVFSYTLFVFPILHGAVAFFLVAFTSHCTILTISALFMSAAEPLRTKAIIRGMIHTHSGLDLVGSYATGLLGVYCRNELAYLLVSVMYFLAYATLVGCRGAQSRIDKHAILSTLTYLLPGIAVDSMINAFLVMSSGAGRLTLPRGVGGLFIRLVMTRVETGIRLAHNLSRNMKSAITQSAIVFSITIYVFANKYSGVMLSILSGDTASVESEATMVMFAAYTGGLIIVGVFEAVCDNGNDAGAWTRAVRLLIKVVAAILIWCTVIAGREVDRSILLLTIASYLRACMAWDPKNTGRHSCWAVLLLAAFHLVETKSIPIGIISFSSITYVHMHDLKPTTNAN